MIAGQERWAYGRLEDSGHPGGRKGCWAWLGPDNERGERNPGGKKRCQSLINWLKVNLVVRKKRAMCSGKT